MASHRGKGSDSRAPAWVRVVGVIAALFVLVVVVLHLSHGRRDHGMGDHALPAGAGR
jgi:hypothetical protein